MVDTPLGLLQRPCCVHKIQLLLPYPLRVEQWLRLFPNWPLLRLPVFRPSQAASSLPYRPAWLLPYLSIVNTAMRQEVSPVTKDASRFTKPCLLAYRIEHK